MTPDQIAILKETELPRERWLGDENQMPLIRELMDQGFMQPAYGEFKLRETQEPQETVNVMGKVIPIAGTMVSLYMLTPYGRSIYHGFVEVRA